MNIEPGSRLGPYEITVRAGAGGMGEVWRGRDTRLGRDVAIKVLPAEFAENAQLRARFDREARSISALSHPHICTLFDVGEGFLVMEFIEGESLAEKIARGPLPLSEVLRYGQQIAAALDAAHRKGIVHRDLKPGNIMITKSGAKLLDFGLARAMTASGPISSLTGGTTAVQPLTAEGVIVGTLQYMSPEQLDGLEPDARTDIFSLGTVLYEMVTGQRAFAGSTKTSLISAIVSSEPRPIGELIPLTPPALEHVVRKCLAKDPDQRWQSAADIAGELQWISELTTSGSHLVGTTPKTERRWNKAAAGIAAIVVLGAALLTGWYAGGRTKSAGTSTPFRGSIALPPGTQLAGWASPTVAISPDGSVVAFVASKDGRQQLYLRRLDAFEARLVEGSDGAEGPFFSPDGKWVGFGAGAISARSTEPRALKKAAVDGGPAQTLTPVADYFGGSWGDDGNVYFTDGFADGLWRVSASGGSAERISATKSENPDPLLFPRILPGSSAALVITLGDQGVAQPSPAIYDLSTKTLTPLGVHSTSVRLLSGNRLLFVRNDGVLMVAPISVERRALEGGAVPLMSGITITSQDSAVFDISQNGTAVFAQGYVSGSGRELHRLVHLDAKGTITPLPFEPDELVYAAGSPDRTRIAATLARGELVIYDLERKTRMKLPAGDVIFKSAPVWSPDGKILAFNTKSRSTDRIHVQSADGSDLPRPLFPGMSHAEYWPSSFTPDGGTLLYQAFGHTEGSAEWDLWITPLADPAAARRLLVGFNGQISPDGTRMAYESSETGRWEVYIVTFPELRDKVLVSTGGGKGTTWSRDGRTLYYWQDTELMAVDIGPPVGVPRRLFEADLGQRFRRRVLPLTIVDDGFLTHQPVPGTGVQTHLLIATGWDDEVEKALRQE